MTQTLTGYTVCVENDGNVTMKMPDSSHDMISTALYAMSLVSNVVNASLVTRFLLTYVFVTSSQECLLFPLHLYLDPQTKREAFAAVLRAPHPSVCSDSTGDPLPAVTLHDWSRPGSPCGAEVNATQESTV